MQRKTIMERMENEKRKQQAEFHIDRTPGKVDLLQMRNITLYKDLFPTNHPDIQIIVKLRKSSVSLKENKKNSCLNSFSEKLQKNT